MQADGTSLDWAQGSRQPTFCCPGYRRSAADFRRPAYGARLIVDPILDQREFVRMRTILLSVVAVVILFAMQITPTGAAAEWCEHDPLVVMTTPRGNTVE